MKCPYCNNPDTKVIDSRPTEDGRAIRRRRSCDRCQRRFTTYEKAEASIVMIVKKDGRRETFDRDKVINGIVKACDKRSVSRETIEKMAESIERGLNNLMEKEVSSDFIGELVMNELREVDQVAYIRFASVYRQFTDVETFAEEINKLRKKSQMGVYNASTKAPKKKDNIKIVAIDGPSGAGKSTVAKMLANKLGYDYIDTGAMYRAIAYKMLEEGIAPKESKSLSAILEDTSVDFNNNKIFLDGQDVSALIRNEQISKAASEFSALPCVREKLVDIQRSIAENKSIVMDGRDIGTNVFPNADYKFYLDASAEERAKRRFDELKVKDKKLKFEDVLRDVEERDRKDTTRKLNPLRKAKDAIVIDSTSMTADEVVSEMYKEIKE